MKRLCCKYLEVSDICYQVYIYIFPVVFLVIIFSRVSHSKMKVTVSAER